MFFLQEDDALYYFELFLLTEDKPDTEKVFKNMMLLKLNVAKFVYGEEKQDYTGDDNGKEFSMSR